MVIAQKCDYKEQLTDIKKNFKKVTLMTTQIQQQLNEKKNPATDSDSPTLKSPLTK